MFYIISQIPEIETKYKIKLFYGHVTYKYNIIYCCVRKRSARIGRPIWSPLRYWPPYNFFGCLSANSLNALMASCLFSSELEVLGEPNVLFNLDNALLKKFDKLDSVFFTTSGSFTAFFISLYDFDTECLNASKYSFILFLVASSVSFTPASSSCGAYSAWVH